LGKPYFVFLGQKWVLSDVMEVEPDEIFVVISRPHGFYGLHLLSAQRSFSFAITRAQPEHGEAFPRSHTLPVAVERLGIDQSGAMPVAALHGVDVTSRVEQTLPRRILRTLITTASCADKALAVPRNIDHQVPAILGNPIVLLPNPHTS
jgi:hypothetical protein